MVLGEITGKNYGERCTSGRSCVSAISQQPYTVKSPRCSILRVHQDLKRLRGYIGGARTDNCPRFCVLQVPKRRQNLLRPRSAPNLNTLSPLPKHQNGGSGKGVGAACRRVTSQRNVQTLLGAFGALLTMLTMFREATITPRPHSLQHAPGS